MKTEYVLGTAQLGLEYGIANEGGRPSQKNAHEIVLDAWRAGARYFDTAQGYGESESVLGAALSQAGILGEVQVISKVSPHFDPFNAEEWLEFEVGRSLARLRSETLYGMMLHRYSWLQCWGKGLGSEMKKLVDKCIINKIGVSLYSIEEFAGVLENDDMELIQVPCNFFSPELLIDGWLEEASKKRKQVFVRSIFLQGLLLMDIEKAQRRLPFAVEALKRWHGICNEYNYSPFTMCLKFARGLDCSVVIGADTAKQASKNGDIYSVDPFTRQEIQSIYSEIKPYIDERITNPALWS
ncbi:MAG: aldo/keto reductase [Fibrobacterales bacterium]